MVDLTLLAGKLLLLALVYLFLFAAIRAGMGLVRDSRARAKASLVLHVLTGPRELAGSRVPIDRPVVIGRSSGADIVIANDFVSGRHARIAPQGDHAIIEDLDSTNGTVLEGQRITAPMSRPSI
jgi:pSer/pThr/pTyr-binding forkhead associated (FHA) protein